MINVESVKSRIRQICDEILGSEADFDNIRLVERIPLDAVSTKYIFAFETTPDEGKTQELFLAFRAEGAKTGKLSPVKTTKGLNGNLKEVTGFSVSVIEEDFNV